MDRFKVGDSVIITHSGEWTSEERIRLGWPSHMDGTSGKVGEVMVVKQNCRIKGVVLTRYHVYVEEHKQAWFYNEESLRRATKWRAKKIAKHGAGNKV